MSEPFIAEIRMFGCNYAPRNWALCNGQLLAIAQNSALFSLLGTYYGGDGRTTFGLPNLQSRAPMFWGSGAGLTQRVIGQTGGVNAVTLDLSTMPSHNHPANAKTSGGNASPSGMIWGTSQGGKVAANFYASVSTPQVALSATALASVGGGQPHNNLMPYNALNFCIALQGIFPPRS